MYFIEKDIVYIMQTWEKTRKEQRKEKREENEKIYMYKRAYIYIYIFTYFQSEPLIDYL